MPIQTAAYLTDWSWVGKIKREKYIAQRFTIKQNGTVSQKKRKATYAQLQWGATVKATQTVKV